MATSTLSRPKAATHPSAFLPFLAYVVAFHLVWIVWPYVVYPRLTAALGNRTLAYAVVQLTIRITVWVVPVLLYLRYVDDVEPFAYLKLRQRVGRGVSIAVGLTVLNLIGSMMRFGVPHPSMDRVTWNSLLGTSILVGVIEEIPYRGFMLQKFAERVGFGLATLVTSLLFLAIHVPGWMALHTFKAGTAATILIFGVVMAVVFKYADSLWGPIATHSANDCISFVLFGR